MKKWFAFLFIFAASCSYAASGHGEAHDGPVEIPRQVMFQAINVTILFIGLFFLLKAGVVKFYKDRLVTYTAAAEKSKLAREQAEKQYLEIKHKIDQLEGTVDDTMLRARAEAAEMKKSLLSDAKEIADRIQKQAQETAKIEIQKAQTHLREQLLKDSIEAAKMVLSKDIGSADHQKLQNDFVNRVQAVNP